MTDKEIIQALQNAGIIDQDNNPTAKWDQMVLPLDSSTDFVNQYREIFPKIRLGSGSYARVDARELQKLLDKFIKVYGYSKETILQATKLYVEHFQSRGYEFMKNSYYFIAKRGEPSVLAQWCEAVKDGVVDQKSVTEYFGSKIV